MTKTTRTRSEIGKRNLAKSKAAERSVAAYYRVIGWPGAERTVRTGYRTSGRTSDDRGDIDGTPGFITQVKAVAPPTSTQVDFWLAETRAQADAARADLGVLVVKRAGHAHPAAWWAYLHLDVLGLLLDDRLDGQLHAVSDIAVRLELADVVGLLRRAGYGTPLECPAQVGGGSEFDCVCADPGACGQRHAEAAMAPQGAEEAS